MEDSLDQKQPVIELTFYDPNGSSAANPQQLLVQSQ